MSKLMWEPTSEPGWCGGDECTAELDYDSGLAVGWTLWVTEDRVGVLCPTCTALYA